MTDHIAVILTVREAEALAILHVPQALDADTKRSTKMAQRKLRRALDSENSTRFQDAATIHHLIERIVR